MDADLKDAQIVDGTLLLLDLSGEETGVVAATHRTSDPTTGLEPGGETLAMDAVTAETESAGV